MCLIINILFIFLTLLINIDSISHNYHQINSNRSYLYRKDARAYSININIRCFSGDSLIKLSNGEYKEISLLKSGDEIITISKTKIISTKFILMLDKQISKKVLFYTLKTLSGHKISLTEYHLIPIKSLNKNLNYLFAKQIKIGDLLYILYNNNNNIQYSPVINITIQIKKGYYAPLTIQGTLLINQILASCFAHTNNHYLAQFFMFPFRFYFKLTQFISLNDPFYNDKSEGLHWFVSFMFYFVHYFIPKTLFLS